MFWTPRPTLETSSVPSLRRPPDFGDALPAPGAEAWSGEANVGTELIATLAPARAAWVKKLRRPIAFAFFTWVLEVSVLFENKSQTRFGGSPILSIYCLFLLEAKNSMAGFRKHDYLG
jgi:hypothetical protein